MTRCSTKIGDENKSKIEVIRDFDNKNKGNKILVLFGL